MQQQLISMTQKELLRYEIIQNLIKGCINGTEAAKQMDLTVRQVKNIKARVIKEGAYGVVHKNRGRKSNKKLPETKINQIETIIKEKYRDFGPTFAAEKLYENHQIKISDETLRHLMVKWGLRTIKPRKQPKKMRFWRPRKDNYGEMQQFDGSYEHWLENRAGELCLLLSVDDATGKITHARFDYNESVMTVFKFWLGYFDKNGLPVSVYLDKFSTYKVNHKNVVDNKELITQLQRTMNQMNVKLITAHSPEAKGRVERIFGTLQDRLIKEMRLAGISSTKDANKFLEEYIPKFNAQFAVAPRRKANLHKKLNKQLKESLPQIFSRQSYRKVNNDYTIMFENRYFQLTKEQPITVYKRDTVIIEEHLDGGVKINLNGRYLNYFVLSERPKKIIDVKLPALTRRKQSDWKPPLNHPWRRSFVFKPQERHSVSSRV
ncbi:MAG: ISNCY family transposase [Patescibacteria group bacterium]